MLVTYSSPSYFGVPVLSMVSREARAEFQKQYKLYPARYEGGCACENEYYLDFCACEPLVQKDHREGFLYLS